MASPSGGKPFEELDYEKLQSNLLEQRRLFEDQAFPATSSSISTQKPSSRDISWLRPWEIVQHPIFIRDNATRFDLDQGQLGDCWFVAASSNFALQGGKLFDNVVIPGQSFKNGEYTGMFRFRFWRFGKFVEVIIDDRLPSRRGRLVYCSNREEPNEFWPALMEKAYAKVNGSYDNLDGGMIQDALIDLTGGIAEVVALRETTGRPPELFDIMMKTYLMNTMMGSSIIKTTNVQNEQALSGGLFAGHAYSITGVAKIRDFNQHQHDIVRLRNPWGRSEWTGAWSDGSSTWNSVSKETKAQLGLQISNDGEFWMPFVDFVNKFDTLEMVHLSPDALLDEIVDDSEKHRWKMVGYDGQWVAGISAGGCGNPPNEAKLWTNPQFHVYLDPNDKDTHNGKCTLIVSLMEKKTIMSQYTSIGFQIYKIKESVVQSHSFQEQMKRKAPPILIDESNYKSIVLNRVATSGSYTNLRQVCKRFELDPGHYVILCTTFQSGQESEFLLRFFSEKSTPTVSELDEVTGPSDPIEKQDQTLKQIFKKYTSDGNAMSATELKRAIDDLVKNEGSEDVHSLESCRSLLAMMDADGSGQLSFDEFTAMYAELKTWKSVFGKFDSDNSGRIDVYELCRAFKDIGFPLSKKVLVPLVKRYALRDMTMGLEEFVLAASRIRCLFGVFMRHTDGGISGKVTLNLDEWLASSIYC